MFILIKPFGGGKFIYLYMHICAHILYLSVHLAAPNLLKVHER